MITWGVGLTGSEVSNGTDNIIIVYWTTDIVLYTRLAEYYYHW